jgi:hypothetical protein
MERVFGSYLQLRRSVYGHISIKLCIVIGCEHRREYAGKGDFFSIILLQRPQYTTGDEGRGRWSDAVRQSVSQKVSSKFIKGFAMTGGVLTQERECN